MGGLVPQNRGRGKELESWGNDTGARLAILRFEAALLDAFRKLLVGGGSIDRSSSATSSSLGTAVAGRPLVRGIWLSGVFRLGFETRSSKVKFSQNPSL